MPATFFLFSPRRVCALIRRASNESLSAGSRSDVSVDKYCMNGEIVSICWTVFIESTPEHKGRRECDYWAFFMFGKASVLSESGVFCCRTNQVRCPSLKLFIVRDAQKDLIGLIDLEITPQAYWTGLIGPGLLSIEGDRFNHSKTQRWKMCSIQNARHFQWMVVEEPFFSWSPDLWVLEYFLITGSR